MVDMTRIGELIADDAAGFACSKSKLVSDGLLHLRPFNVSSTGQLDLSERYQVPFDEAPKDKRRLEAGDILFNNTNSVEWVGKSALIRQPMEAGFSNHMTRVRVDSSRVLPQWFAYWLSRKQATGFFAANATQWVSQAAYRIADLKKLEVYLPPIAEQQRIVDILDRTSSIQRLRKSADDKLRELASALFVDMFGDPASNPKGWKLYSLGEITDLVSSGVTPKGGSDVYVAQGPILVRSQNIRMLHLELSEAAHINETTYRRMLRVHIEPNDVLLNITGASIGRVAVAMDIPDNCVVNQHVCIVRPKHKLISAQYLGFLLASEYWQNVIMTIQAGASRQALNFQQIRSLKIPVPVFDLQVRFEKCAELMRGMADHHRRSADDISLLSPSVAATYFDN
jgi:type I restriction enzyme, S subunit